MLQWSSSYPIPSHNYKFLTAIGKTIWLTTNGYGIKEEKRMDMIVFDTETEEFTEVECKCNFVFPENIFSISSHGSTIYMWACEDRFSSAMMYKMNINTLEWTKNETIALRASSFCSVLIVRNEMYVSTQNNGNSFVLSTINLTTEDIISHKLDLKDRAELHSHHTTLTVFFHDENVYMIENLGTHKIVSLLKENDLIEIAEDEQSDIWRSPRFVENKINGIALYCFNDQEKDQIYTETFDFELNQWTRQNVESTWHPDRFRKKSRTCEIDGKIYMYIKEPSSYRGGKRSSGRRVSDELRVLELKPKLTTICLMDIVNDGIPMLSSRIKKLEVAMPINLRKQLINMIQWKSAEWAHRQYLDREDQTYRPSSNER